LVPVPPPESELLPAEGVPGVLSGGGVGALVAPDWVPFVSAPSLDIANVVAEAAHSKLASNSEVSFMVIMARLQKMSRYLMLVPRAERLVPSG
jgi:hypothetical protein